MKRMLAIAGALVLALPVHAAPVATANPPGRYAPRDECARLPGAAAFRARLARVVARRDAAGLAAMAAPQVELDFGGGSGRALLRRRLAGREGAELWSALDKMLPLGCASSRGNITLPWFFNQDLGDLDVYSVLLVTGANVPLLEAADRNARSLGTLSWQLVEPPGNRVDGEKFVQVDVVGTRRRGYVEASRLRSPIDYRLIAERRRGVWQISAFIAGD